MHIALSGWRAPNSSQIKAQASSKSAIPAAILQTIFWSSSKKKLSSQQVPAAAAS